MRYNKSPVVLPPQLRIDMLKCMCTDDSIKVSDAEIYFIMGDDKMKLLVHLCKKREFLDNFIDEVSEYINNIDKTMKYNVETIKQIISNDPDVKFVYFWGEKPEKNGVTESCLSQWYDVAFEVEGVVYHTAEQYMMAQKALLFNDEEVFGEIMAATSPRDYKKLGRKIRNFESKVWDEKKYEIVVNGNKAKFSQNPELKEYLLSTGNAILAEASPYDKIWGIGLYPSNAAKGTVEDWRGENLLGFALMEVRDSLK